MVQNTIIYEIQPKDTLNSISKEIGMSSNELLDFHNKHCGEFGLLWITGLVGIKKIVVPKNYKSVAEIRKAITDSLPPRNLSLDFFVEKYKVTESFVDFSGKKNEIIYEININSSQNKTSASDFFTLEVNAKDFEKNGLKPDDKMSELALACMNAINPFSFNISPQGKILEIDNFKKLRDNFFNKKEDLLDFFVGEVTIKYIEKFEAHLQNEALFLQQYSSNLLHQVLFLNPDFFYNQGIGEAEFYLVKNSFPVSLLFETTHQHLDDDKIQTTIKGKANEKASLQDLLSGRKLEDTFAEPLDADLTLTYVNHQSTKKLLEANAVILLKFENEIFKKHHLRIHKI